LSDGDGVLEDHNPGPTVTGLRSQYRGAAASTATTSVDRSGSSRPPEEPVATVATAETTSGTFPGVAATSTATSPKTQEPGAELVVEEK
jgi:hypothetical protein